MKFTHNKSVSLKTLIGVFLSAFCMMAWSVSGTVTSTITSTASPTGAVVSSSTSTGPSPTSSTSSPSPTSSTSTSQAASCRRFPCNLCDVFVIDSVAITGLLPACTQTTCQGCTFPTVSLTLPPIPSSIACNTLAPFCKTTSTTTQVVSSTITAPQGTLTSTSTVTTTITGPAPTSTVTQTITSTTTTFSTTTETDTITSQTSGITTETPLIPCSDVPGGNTIETTSYTSTNANGTVYIVGEARTCTAF